MRSQSNRTPLQLILTIPLSIAFALTNASAYAQPGPDGEDPRRYDYEEDDGVTETLVVYGSTPRRDRDELAIPVDRVSREELLRNLGSTLGESISKIPGITSTGFAAGASRPIIRGQDAYRTEVLEDGLRTQDVSKESPDHAVAINPLAAQRIEIIRGPATLRYGGGASAGVINTITNRVPDRLPESGISGEIFASVGTLANERDFAASLDGNRGSFAWHGDGVFRRANNYSIPNNDNPHTQSGSKLESYAGSVGGAYFAEIGRIGFSYTRLENHYGIPVQGESVDVEMKSDRFRFEADLTQPLKGIREIRVRGVYSNYKHDEVEDQIVGQTFRNQEFEGRLEVIHAPFLGFQGAIGLHSRTRNFRGEGEAAEFLAPTETQMAALYVVEKRELPANFAIQLGLRIETVRVEGRDIGDQKRDRRFLPLSGSLGLHVHPTDWLTIAANTSVSQRAPSQVELLARGPHEATSTFEIGNPLLDPETSYAGELRVELNGNRGRIELAGFATLYRDFILGTLTGNTVDEAGLPIVATDPEALQELRYRSRDAVFFGGEIAGSFEVLSFEWGRFGIDGRFDLVHARFRKGGESKLPRIVPIRWGSGLFFESERFDARISFLRTEAQEANAKTEGPTASFIHLNASIAYRVSLLEEAVPLELTLVGSNLTDSRGRNHVAFNKEDILLPGRSLRLGLRVQF